MLATKSLTRTKTLCLCFIASYLTLVRLNVSYDVVINMKNACTNISQTNEMYGFDGILALLKAPGNNTRSESPLPRLTDSVYEFASLAHLVGMWYYSHVGPSAYERLARRDAQMQYTTGAGPMHGALWMHMITMFRKTQEVNAVHLWDYIFQFCDQSRNTSSTVALQCIHGSGHGFVLIELLRAKRLTTYTACTYVRYSTPHLVSLRTIEVAVTACKAGPSLSYAFMCASGAFCQIVISLLHRDSVGTALYDFKGELQSPVDYFPCPVLPFAEACYWIFTNFLGRTPDSIASSCNAPVNTDACWFAYGVAQHKAKFVVRHDAYTTWNKEALEEFLCKRASAVTKCMQGVLFRMFYISAFEYDLGLKDVRVFCRKLGEEPTCIPATYLKALPASHFLELSRVLSL